MRIINYTELNTGWWCEGSSNPFCVGESPVFVKIFYKDKDGKRHLWHVGFIESDIYNKSGYVYIPVNEWYDFESENLMNIDPKPAFIDYILVGGTGWDFKGDISYVHLYGK